MSLKETECLVLKSYNLGDADRIVVFLTEEHGVIRAVAKGAKRLKSRFGGGLEPFTIGKLTYFQKEAVELVSIRQLDLVESYFAAAAQPAFLQKFSYLSELLLSMTPPDDPNNDLYRMFKACLKVAAEQPDSLPSIGLYFELWLLRLNGYLPDWERCRACGTVLAGDVQSDLQSNFHLICPRCRRSAGATSISADERDLYRSAQKLSPSNFVDLAEKLPTEINSVSAILRRVISHVTGREVTGEKSLVLSAAE